MVYSIIVVTYRLHFLTRYNQYRRVDSSINVDLNCCIIMTCNISMSQLCLIQFVLIDVVSLYMHSHTLGAHTHAEHKCTQRYYRVSNHIHCLCVTLTCRTVEYIPPRAPLPTMIRSNKKAIGDFHSATADVASFLIHEYRYGICYILCEPVKVAFLTERF